MSVIVLRPNRQLQVEQQLPLRPDDGIDSFVDRPGSSFQCLAQSIRLTRLAGSTLRRNGVRCCRRLPTQRLSQEGHDGADRAKGR
jgi:hypothetical protein